MNPNDPAAQSDDETDWAVYWEESNRKEEALLQEYVGATCLALGRAITDPWGKRTWFGNRIKDMGRIAGIQEALQLRCRRTDSEAYQRYEKRKRDAESVAASLLLELLAIKDNP